MFTEIEIICSPHFLCDISPSLEINLIYNLFQHIKEMRIRNLQGDPPSTDSDLSQYIKALNLKCWGNKKAQEF